MSSKPPTPRSDGAESATAATAFDAIIVVSFGGPEGMADVVPFLENVTRGRGVPPERLAEVAEHYSAFNGVSPINEQNRALIAALREELDRHAIDLPIYFGNRNWHPLLPDTLEEMTRAGVKRALAFFTSGFSCYSGCRQYREDIWRAQQAVGPDAPEIVKTRMFYNHPGFVAAMAERVGEAREQLPTSARAHVPVLFSAHSIPGTMARHSRYESQLAESARLVAEAAAIERYEVVYQSRSGPAHVPWLEPDVNDRVKAYAEAGETAVLVAPLGFVSDHIEVLFDLDEEAHETATTAGLAFARAGTVGTHPTFVAAIRELITERLDLSLPRRALGSDGPSHETCPTGCCLPGTGKPSPWETD